MKLSPIHLRDLFWLTLVIALILGWWLDHRRLAPIVRAHHDLMERFMSMYDALADYGVEAFVDPGTQKVTLVNTGMGKERWDAHVSRIDQEINNLQEIEITGSPTP